MLEKNRVLSLITNRFLELIILPTEQCNFRCTYCYEDFAIGRMKSNVIEAIKTLLTHRISTLDELKISWFGGEPLLAINSIYHISHHIQDLLNKYPQVFYQAGMTTNALLLNLETLQKLVSLGIKTYQVSLDGTEDMHNKTRPKCNGRGTFREIWCNLLAARDSQLDFSIMLRIHVTPENILDLYELIENIKAAFGYDSRFSLFFKAIENLGGKNAGSFKVLYGKDKEEIINKLKELVGDALAIKNINDKGSYVCYAAQPNSLVIRADGRLSKCTVAFQDERNVIGQIASDGTLHVNSDRLALWIRGIKSQISSELSCPMYQLPSQSKIKNIPIEVSS